VKMEEPPKKRFGRKKAAPAPRPARVRPRLSVTVLGVPDPGRPLIGDSDTPGAAAAPAPGEAFEPFGLDTPGEPAVTTRPAAPAA